MSAIVTIPPVVADTWKTYAHLSDMILSGEPVTVECHTETYLQRVRSGVRAHVVKAGGRMWSAKQGTTICLWAKYRRCHP